MGYNFISSKLFFALRPAVNFINVFCVRFLYERHFGSFFLVTYVAHLDLLGDPLQDTCQRTCPRFIFKIRKILYVGYRRIFP